jgi:hypothetical protein
VSGWINWPIRAVAAFIALAADAPPRAADNIPVVTSAKRRRPSSYAPKCKMLRQSSRFAVAYRQQCGEIVSTDL